jgi:translation initiation factor IF-3
VDGKQLGVLSLNEALTMARQNGVDLVEIAASAMPPVCRLVNLGKFRYEKAKKEKESKKNQHASIVKEVQLSPRIDPHDLSIKIEHAVGFLCEDMKVKIVLKFRGREMAHQEFGFQVVRKFLADIAPFGRQDFEPKLIGRGINVMITPLPRNKRAKNPYQVEGAKPAVDSQSPKTEEPAKSDVPVSGEPSAGSFINTPFANIQV